MRSAEGAPSAERLDLERAFLASFFGRGAPALAELVGAPDPAPLLTGPRRLAFEAGVGLLKRNEVVGPIPPDKAAEEVLLHGGPDLAEQVRDAIDIALISSAAEAGKVGSVGRLASSLADLLDSEVANRVTPATPILSVEDIFAPLPPVNWLLEALDVAPGAPMLVAGYGFSGKTVSLQDLALAVATGTDAWGRFPVRAGRVLHVDYEQGSYLTRMRYQRLARARDIDPADLADRLALVSLPGWYLDGDTRDEFLRLCEGYDLLIVDSFRAACPSTDENSSDARIPLDRLGRIAEQTGITPVVIHHARKPSQNAAGGARMSVRGSGALYDACGSVLVFAAEKNEPIAVSHEKARISGRTHDGFRLIIEDVEIDGDALAGLRVLYLDAATANAKATPEDQFADLKRRVLALVREEGTFVGGVNLLRVRLGGRKEDIGAAVGELVRSGAVQQGGTYHKPTYSVGTDGDC